MAVYKYRASASAREDFSESGTIVADSEEEAREKLKQFHFDKIYVKRITGLAALLGRLTANIK